MFLAKAMFRISLWTHTRKKHFIPFINFFPSLHYKYRESGQTWMETATWLVDGDIQQRGSISRCFKKWLKPLFDHKNGCQLTLCPTNLLIVASLTRRDTHMEMHVFLTAPSSVHWWQSLFRAFVKKEDWRSQLFSSNLSVLSQPNTPSSDLS